MYRTTLLALLLCPVVGLVLAQAGFTGWSIEMPVAFEYSTGPPVLQADTTSLVPTEFQVTSETMPGAEPRVVYGEALFPVQPGSPDNGFSQRETESSSRFDSAVSLSEVPTAVSGTQAAVPNFRTGDTVPAQVAVFDFSLFGLVGVCVGVIWLSIFAVLSLRVVLLAVRLGRIRTDANRVSESETLGCETVASQLGTSTPEVLRTPFLSSPLLHGILSPAILLPEDDSLILQDVFVHELAHLKRRDCFWLLLKQLATCLFFFQPLLWLLGKRIDSSAEEVCDDYVVQYGGDRERYATALVDIAAQSLVPAAAAGMAMVSFRSLLGQRVARIMDTSRSLSTNVGRALLVLVLIAGLAGTTAVGFVGLNSDEQQTEPRGQIARIETQKSSPAKPAVTAETSSEPAVKATKGGLSQPSSVVVVDEELNGGTVDSRVVKGRVVNGSRQGIAGAKVWWFRSRVHDIDPMKPVHVATADKNGNFSFTRPLIGNPKTEPATWDFRETFVIQADGYAVLRSWSGAHNGLHQMEPLGEALRGRIVDIDGQPVVGATLRIRRFTKPPSRGSSGFASFAESLFSGKEETKKTTSIEEWRTAVSNLVNVIEPVPQRFVYPSAVTDENGEFELSGIGKDWMLELLLEGRGIQSTDILVSTALQEAVTIPPGRGSTSSAQKLYGNGLLFAAGPSRVVSGSVTDLETGDPIANAVVRAYSIHGRNLHSSRELQHLATRTDTQGRYTIAGLPIGKDNMLVTFATDGKVPWFPASQRADTTPDTESVDVNFRLLPGVWAEGRVTDGSTGEPFTGEITYHWFRDKAFEVRHPGIRNQFLDGVYWTNVNGEFRIPVLPTRGILAYRWAGPPPKDVMAPRPIDKFPRGLGADAIEGIDNQMASFPTMPRYMHAGNFNFVKEVNPSADAETVPANMKLRASEPIQIQITSPQGVDLPNSGYLVYGLNERWGWQSGQTRSCTVVDLLPAEKRKVFVYHRQSGLGGAAVVHEGIKQPVNISLMKTGRVKARVYNKDGDLVDNGSISVAYEKLQGEEKYAIWASHPTKRAMPCVIPINENGYFELDGLIPGWKYSARVNAPQKMQGRMMDVIIGMAFVDLEVKPGETIDLGDVTASYPDRDEPEDRKPEEKGAAVSVSSKASGISTRLSDPAPPMLSSQVLSPEGKPVVDAEVKLTAFHKIDSKTEVIGTTRTDETGHFSLATAGLSPIQHRSSSLVVRHTTQGIAWSEIAVDKPTLTAPLRLLIERPIRGRFVDVDGQPLVKVKIQLKAVFTQMEEGREPEDGVNTEHEKSLRHQREIKVPGLA